MTLIRSIAIGVLFSMLFTYAMHYFGEWKMENYRPDPDTTSSVIVFNKCAVFNDVHILRPNTTTSSGNDVTNELKLTGSFMNFFDGHVVVMIIIAIVLGLIVFGIRTGLKKNVS